MQGVRSLPQNDEDRQYAMEHAFDYRGDVTITQADGRVVEGYVFDRRLDVDEPYIRLIPRDGGGRLKIPYDQVKEMTFSGKDTAAGKSWETWVKQYQEKKAEGQTAERTPEPLED